MKRLFTSIFVLLLYTFAAAQNLITEDFGNTPPPAPGWVYTNPSGTAPTHSANNFRSAPRCLALRSSGNTVTTPMLINPGTLSFWYRRSSNTAAWSATVEILDGDDRVIATLPGLSAPTTTYQNYTANISAYAFIKIRITDTRASGAHERYIDDFVVTEDPNPKLITSRDTVKLMTYELGSGPSDIDSFMLYGLNLTPANDELTLSLSNVNFEISTSPTGPFANILTFPYVGGNTTTKIYTRLIAALPKASYNSTLNITGGGAVIKKVRFEGEVTAPVIPPCTPNVSTFTVYPASGSEGTEIRITKSGTEPSNFNEVSAVRFGNIPATSYRIANQDTIFAVVPNGMTGNKIILEDGEGCSRNSTTNFTFLRNNGSCGSVYTDLIISEIQDPQSGNNHYIEIYNGTDKSIDLTAGNYGLRLIQMPQNITNNAAITGTIVSGQVLVYYAGSNGGLATGTQSGSLTGFNESDHIILKKGSNTIVDVFEAPNSTRYNYRRKTNVPGPSNTFDSNDWTTHAPSTTDDIGYFNPASAVEITVHPTSSSGCSIEMSVNATSSGTLAYKWYYNNNSDSTATLSRNWHELVNGTTQFDGINISGATSKNLAITGDITELRNSQFYCVVSSGACEQYSNTAQFNLIYDKYFRTKKTGEWRKADTWEVSPTGGVGTWSNACTFPWDTNSVAVQIMNSHTVTIPEVSSNTPDVLIYGLTIEEGGTLEIESTAEFQLNDGPGIDLKVLGTLYDKGNSGSNGFLTPLKSATWELGNNGTLIRAGSSSTTNYRDSYHNSIINIPASAHWIYRKESGSAITPVSINMYYPNLYFENISGAGWVTNFTGSSTNTVVKGNLILRGIDNTSIGYANTNSSPLNILGNLEIEENNTLRTYINASTDIGTGIEIHGNIFNNGSLNVNHNDTYILLNGTGTQTISGTGTFNIHNLKIEKQFKSLVDLQCNLEVKTELSFDGGIIQTNSNEIYVSNTDPDNAITGFDVPNGTGIYSDDNYIIGRLRRKMGTPGSTYTFPIGVPTIGYNPARITVANIPNANAFASGQFIHSNPGLINVYRQFDCAGSTKFLEYTELTNEGYWEFDSPYNYQNYTINIHPNILNSNIYPNNDSPPGGYSNTYRALKEDVSKAGAIWDPDASTLGDPCIVSDNYYDIIGAGYSGFSIFAPGGGIADGPTTALPVELLYFDIECRNLPVLKWATASEWNSRYFTVESSSDGIHFGPIEQIEAATQSSQKTEYSYILNEKDYSLYYRLTETDWDGYTTHYKIISNSCTSHYPSQNKVFYRHNQGITAQLNSGKLPVIAQIFDSSGRLIHRKKLTDLHTQILVPSYKYSKGVFFIHLIFDNREIETYKVAVY